MGAPRPQPHEAAARERPGARLAAHGEQPEVQGRVTARDAGAPDADELVLVTHGRYTGREHRVRLWFAEDGDLLWLRADERVDPRGAGWISRRAGRRPDWLLNLIVEPRCRVIVGDRELGARYEPSSDPDADIKRLVELWRTKYGAEWVQDWYVERGRLPVRLRIHGRRDAHAE